MINTLARSGSGHLGVAARYIPQGATKVADKKSDAVAYLHTARSGRPAAIAYVGKQSKAVWHFNFKDEAAREKRIAELFKGRQASLAYRQERKAEAAKPHKLQLGHILYSSWGYEQTNIDWYEVTKVIGAHMVEVRKIASNLLSGAGGDHGTCAPKGGAFIGEPTRHRVRHNGVKISSCQHATLWDGRPRSWSSWH